MTTINSDYTSPYLTSAWLDSHAGASQALSSNPEFAAFLNDNPDYAQSFTESAQGAQTAIEAAGNAGAIGSEAMDRLLGEASLAQGTMGARDEAMFKDYNDYVTADWLKEHPGAALLLQERPELADFLNANPDQAENFTLGSDGATKAVEALLAQQPDLGWDVAQLVPGEVNIATQETTPEQTSADATLGSDQGYI